MIIPYVKTDAIEFALSVLNDFHKNIKFTYKTKDSGEINFLLEKETQHLEHVLVNVNGYLTKLVRQIIQKEVMELSQIQSSEAIDANEETEQMDMFILRYKKN